MDMFKLTASFLLTASYGEKCGTI